MKNVLEIDQGHHTTPDIGESRDNSGRFGHPLENRNLWKTGTRLTLTS